MSEKYYVVAAKSELTDTPQLHVELNGEEILLCRDGDQYYAVAYFCSHQEFALEGGSIHQGCITCPYHGAEFNLETGEALTAPAFESIRTYPVKLEEETISIGIPEV
jgi:3-phenylpropionate/trans-cinnamate dioxygenase ferredoxin subunit